MLLKKITMTTCSNHEKLAPIEFKLNYGSLHYMAPKNCNSHHFDEFLKKNFKTQAALKPFPDLIMSFKIASGWKIAIFWHHALQV